jgi:plastocyanin
MRLLPLIIIAALVAAAPAVAAPRNVKVGDNFFVRAGDPPTVKVKKGKRVKWNWAGSNPHNVTVESGPATFRSDTMTSGRFTRKLRKTGTYRIICSIHEAGGMRMTLRVRAG